MCRLSKNALCQLVNKNYLSKNLSNLALILNAWSDLVWKQIWTRLFINIDFFAPELELALHLNTNSIPLP